MKVRILGCGTSTGVPKIGNGWGECDPAEPRNRRLRTSILVETAGKHILVDCGPDLRQQLLSAGIDRLDAVIVTHTHGDHCHGIDELRPVMQAMGAAVQLHARNADLAELRQRFTYAFDAKGLYQPIVDGVDINGDLTIGEAQIRFVDQPHGGITSLGMRFDEGGRSLAYSVDFSEMTAEMKELYEGSDIWIADCLSRRPHPTHAHLGLVLDSARELGIGEVYLVHMGNSLDYHTLVDELPSNIRPAHDELEIDL